MVLCAGRYTGDSENREPKLWDTLLGGSEGLVEIPQDEHTHHGPVCSSKLDRAYLRSHAADGQDRDTDCVPYGMTRNYLITAPSHLGGGLRKGSQGTNRLLRTFFVKLSGEKTLTRNGVGPLCPRTPRRNA